MKKVINDAFKDLTEYAASLVSHPIHVTLLVRKIEECKRLVLADKEKEDGRLP